MKKILLTCCLVVLLTGCSDDAINDSFAAYRHKTAAQLYYSANKMIKKHNYDDAVKELEAQNALYPFGAYAEEGQVDLIYAYYKDGESDEALAVADRYLRLYPQGKYADYVYYMKGIISEGRGFSWVQKKLGVDPTTRDVSSYKDAFMSLSSLVRYFPRSKYAPDAIIRMRYIRNALANHELSIAKFYFKRDAYVAAVNRANIVVQHYDQSSSVVGALGVMVKSYRALGLSKMAGNTMAILKANYPHSPVYLRLRG